VNVTKLRVSYVSGLVECFSVPDDMKVVELARSLLIGGQTLKRVEVVNEHKPVQNHTHV